MILSKVARVVLTGKQAPTMHRTFFSALDIGKRHPKPYDYLKKSYGLVGSLLDSTVQRLNDNSLIITVDGNFGSGKSEFARQLAKDIDFLYAREIDLDHMLYQTPVGSNYRKIVNKIVGDNERFRINTVDEWHSNPTFKRTVQLQYKYYYARLFQYHMALLHLFSTGQGVVIERSPFSDGVIARALFEHQFLSKEAWNFYKNDYVEQTLFECWKPHVMIYLDRSPQECLDNIRANGKEYEKKSKVYSIDFLKTVDSIYKKEFIAQYAPKVNMLQYDPKTISSDEVIINLEAIDLDHFDKLEDWKVRRVASVDDYRSRLSDVQTTKDNIKALAGHVGVPEYAWWGAEYKELQECLDEHPDLQYEHGFTEKDSLSSKLLNITTKPERKQLANFLF